MNQKLKWVVAIIIIAAVIGAGFYFLWQSQHAKNEKLAQFAQCLKDKGALFYGAFWCPHCQAQKALFNTLFESAADKLPYIECSTPDTNGQLPVCKDQGIESYPTWKFADGTKQEGEVTFQQLSDKTGCPVPN